MAVPAEDQLRDALALNLVRGVGPRLQTVLLETFGSATAALNAPVEQWRQIPGVGVKIIRELQERNHRDMARRELADCQADGLKLLTLHDAAYPGALREIADPPVVLYQKGSLLPGDSLAVAIVGSRNCTMYGRRMAERIAGGLARAGITIVSGLARGIDGFAHRAALQAGGRTIAVCASGLRTVYPPEHANLAEEIAAQGALLSESPLERKPRPGLFPQRNRIVSGMSLGVIVIEASTTSGTLHTARHAMEQGREVCALPGPVDSRESEGCHALIRDGVKLVRGVDDILEELGPLTAPIAAPTRPRTEGTAVSPAADPNGQEVRAPRELVLSDQQKAILNLLHDEPVHIDRVIDQSGLEPSRVLSTLTVLEMKRLVKRLPGNYLSRLPR